VLIKYCNHAKATHRSSIAFPLIGRSSDILTKCGPRRIVAVRMEINVIFAGSSASGNGNDVVREFLIGARDFLEFDVAPKDAQNAFGRERDAVAAQLEYIEAQ